MAELIIKRKDVVYKVTLDDEDLEKVNALGKWYISAPGRGTCFYAEKQLTPKQLETLNNERLEKGLQPLKKQTILMHRYILDLSCNNTYTDPVIDHIDGNGLNNTKSNLRLCNRSQNAMNKKLKSNSKTGWRGVRKIISYSRGRNKTLAILKKPWCAYITPKGQKRINIGYYETPEEAARAYDEKAKELFGEFAKLNFP
jgi:hypothetical protein